MTSLQENPNYLWPSYTWWLRPSWLWCSVDINGSDMHVNTSGCTSCHWNLKMGQTQDSMCNMEAQKSETQQCRIMQVCLVPPPTSIFIISLLVPRWLCLESKRQCGQRLCSPVSSSELHLQPYDHHKVLSILKPRFPHLYSGLYTISQKQTRLHLFWNMYQ